MFQKLSVLILLALAIAQCNAAKILAFLPLPILSHHIVFRPIFKELANRGHDLTLVTMIPVEDANYKQIIVTEDKLKKLHGMVYLMSSIPVCLTSSTISHVLYKNR